MRVVYAPHPRRNRDRPITLLDSVFHTVLHNTQYALLDQERFLLPEMDVSSKVIISTSQSFY